MNSKQRRFLQIVLSAMVCVLLWPARQAQAMHITEGILPVGWCAFWGVAVLPIVIIGILEVARRKESVPMYMPLLGIVGSLVFVFSCFPIPVPIVGTCSHPAGTGLSAILLGFFPSVLVTSVALLLQALFLAHGGLSTLGANIFSMGVLGSLAGVLAYRGARRLRLGLFASAFAAGFAADIATYAGTSVEMAAGIHGDVPIGSVASSLFLLFLPTQIPLALLEGLLMGMMMVYVWKRRPDILMKMKAVMEGDPEPKRGRAIAAGAVSVLCIVGALIFVFATEHRDLLETIAISSEDPQRVEAALTELMKREDRALVGKVAVELFPKRITDARLAGDEDAAAKWKSISDQCAKYLANVSDDLPERAGEEK